MAASKALGTTFKFTPSGGSEITVGKLTSIGEVSPDSSEIDVTTLDSANGYREFIQGLKDSGEIALAGFHDSADTGQTGMRTAFGTGAVGAAVITFPDNTTVSFNAFVKGHTIGAAEVDGAVGFGATLRITGAITVV
jgi:predicted secreted protein